MLNVPDDVTVQRYQWSRILYCNLFHKYHGEHLTLSITLQCLSCRMSFGCGLMPPEGPWAKLAPNTGATLTIGPHVRSHHWGCWGPVPSNFWATGNHPQ